MKNLIITLFKANNGSIAKKLNKSLFCIAIALFCLNTLYDVTESAKSNISQLLDKQISTIDKIVAT